MTYEKIEPKQGYLVELQYLDVETQQWCRAALLHTTADAPRIAGLAERLTRANLDLRLTLVESYQVPTMDAQRLDDRVDALIAEKFGAKDMHLDDIELREVKRDVRNQGRAIERIDGALTELRGGIESILAALGKRTPEPAVEIVRVDLEDEAIRAKLWHEKQERIALGHRECPECGMWSAFQGKICVDCWRRRPGHVEIVEAGRAPLSVGVAEYDMPKVERVPGPLAHIAEALAHAARQTPAAESHVTGAPHVTTPPAHPLAPPSSPFDDIPKGQLDSVLQRLASSGMLDPSESLVRAYHAQMFPGGRLTQKRDEMIDMPIDERPRGKLDWTKVPRADQTEHGSGAAANLRTEGMGVAGITGRTTIEARTANGKLEEVSLPRVGDTLTPQSRKSDL